MSSAPKTAQGTRKNSSLSQTLVNKGKPQILTVQTNTQTKRVSQSQLDGTMHRLSKPTQIKTTVAPQSAQSEKYSTKYFREHPEEDDDLRPSKEKLMDYDNIEEGTSKETFIALMKQKILREIEYGEVSKEVAESHVALGRYYQQTDRPKSAIRHYNSGKEISKTTGFQSDDSSTALAIGLAESHMELKQEGKKHVSQAAHSLEEVKDSEIVDGQLHFRRDKIKADIAYEQRKQECCEYYIQAEQTMVDNSLDDEDLKTADFYFKIATVLKEYEINDKIEKYARKAADLYRKLKKDDEADKAEDLIPKPEEEEEENYEEDKPKESTESFNVTEKTETGEEETKNDHQSLEEDDENNQSRLKGIIVDTIEGENDKKDVPEVTFQDL